MYKQNALSQVPLPPDQLDPTHSIFAIRKP